VASYLDNDVRMCGSAIRPKMILKNARGMEEMGESQDEGCWGFEGLFILIRLLSLL